MSDVTGSPRRRRWWRVGGGLACVALLTCIGLLGFCQTTAFAAGRVGEKPPAPLAVLVLKAPAQVTKPADSCLFTEWLTPESQTTTLGQTTSITEHWSCGPLALMLIVFDFGDGSNTSYWCVLNCFSGSQTFTHTYPRRGTFTPYDGTAGVGVPSATVVVR